MHTVKLIIKEGAPKRKYSWREVNIKRGEEKMIIVLDDSELDVFYRILEVFDKRKKRNE